RQFTSHLGLEKKHYNIWLAEGRIHGGEKVMSWMRGIQLLCSEKRRSGGTTAMAFLQHQLHRDVVNVILIWGTSLTMPSRHLLILNIRWRKCPSPM
ncbi:hypothetical protein, partial [Shewanella atlantica]|uniref:hypothetical protein n=1 Tax=Shewanella atlantica TaxID=271099 RepID=UPI003736B2C0